MIRVTALSPVMALVIALGPGLAAAARADESRTVRGALGYLQRIALPSEARALVVAEGRFGALLGERTIDSDGRQVPLPFEMAVPPDLSGEVSAVIRVHGQPRWVLAGVRFAAGRDTVDLGDLTLEPVTPLAFATEFVCGDTPILVGILGDEMVLRVEGRDIRLNQVRAASGARYEAETDPDTSVWNKGEEISVRLDGRDLPDCRAVPADAATPYRARGNEPGWHVAFGAETAEIVADYGEIAREVARPAVQVVPGAYAFDMPDANARLRIEEHLCRDDATGMPHPDTAQLTLDDRVLRGCGGAPHDLLMGPPWQVTAIAGEPVIDPSLVSLNFVTPGRVAGSTGCNRLVGGVTLTGEGLSFGPAGSTMMACDEALMAQERRMLDALEQIRRFDIAEDDGLLLIGGPDDSVLLRAERP